MKTKDQNWTFNGTSVLDENGNNACTKKNGPMIAAAPRMLRMLEKLRDGESGGSRWDRDLHDLIRDAKGNS